MNCGEFHFPDCDCDYCELQRAKLELAGAKEHITAYQLRVDNDLLRLKAAYSLAGSE